jgi:hypothetical protein
MRGREFLDLAREVAVGGTEVHRRGTVIHSYYAVILECRDALRRWGVVIPRLQNMHAFVRLKCTYARDVDLRTIGDILDRLVQERNAASYDLSSLPAFATDLAAQRAIQRAVDALALLDGIEGDPARRAAAIASLPP